MSKKKDASGGAATTAVFEPGQDPRVDFVFDIVSRSLKAKVDKWIKMLSTEEYSDVLYNFFNEGNALMLVISMQYTGQLLALSGYNIPLKSKSCYFMKKKPVTFSKEVETNFMDLLICGEVGSQPLDNFIVFFEKVAKPVLLSEAKQPKWPDAVVVDVKKQCIEISDILNTVRGQLEGRTSLPIPPPLESIMEEIKLSNSRMAAPTGWTPGDPDLELKEKLESFVLKWNIQITEVLKESTADLVNMGGISTPFAELAFWEERFKNLSNVFKQLSCAAVKNLSQRLKEMDSGYCATFKILHDNVVACILEARDILAHLRPLRPYLEAVQNSNFEEICKTFRPLFHCICLVWSHSSYYRKPAKIVVLWQLVCNMVIEMARNFLGGSSVFQMEPEEGQTKCESVLRALRCFRHHYELHKVNIGLFFPKAAEVKTWDYLPDLVFARFDKFFVRINCLWELFSTSTEFFKLERIEFGGDHGKNLGNLVHNIYNEFIEFFQQYAGTSYDCCDPDDSRFEQELYAFHEQVEDIDKRLSCIILHAFDDCHTPESAYKMIISLGELLERPIIKEDCQPKLPRFVDMIIADFKAISDQLDKLKDDSSSDEEGNDDTELLDSSKSTPVTGELPPYAAKVNQGKWMKKRMDKAIELLNSVNLPENCLSLRLATKTIYQDLTAKIILFQEEKFSEWKKEIEINADNFLKGNVLKRNEDEDTIEVNFPYKLWCLNKEVKYLRDAGFEGIPEKIQGFVSDSEEIRKNCLNLTSIITCYISALNGCNDFEAALIENNICEIEGLLGAGLTEFRWLDPGLSAYIEQLSNPVKELNDIIEKCQSNVTQIQTICGKWHQTPIFWRKGRSRKSLIDLSEKYEEGKMQKYKMIANGYEQAKNLVQENKQLFGFEKDNGEPWDEYIDSLETILWENLTKAVASSVGFLLDHTDPSLCSTPAFEIKMDLSNNQVMFDPDIDVEVESNLLVLIKNLIEDAFQQTAAVKGFRKDEIQDEKYSDVVTHHKEIQKMVRDIEKRATTAMKQASDYVMRFEPYEYLWEDDKDEYLQQFLKYGRQFPEEQCEQSGNADEESETPASLEQFEEAIETYEKLYKEIESIKTECIFDKWMRLNVTPFKTQLLNLCSQWGMLYKQHLIDHVINGLSELDKFIKDAVEGLSQQLKEGDLPVLLSVMSYLQQVRDRQEKTDAMFEPIKEYIDLLKAYDYELPEAVFIQLQELPIKWSETKTLATQVKTLVGPLQAQEVSSIRKRITEFDSKQSTYRNLFKSYNFFEKEAAFPYTEINRANDEIAELEIEYKDICDAAGLFEVQVSEPKGLKQCRKEITLAKQLWDYIFMIDACIEDWKMTPWQTVNVENMDLECKRIAKEIKATDKDAKVWNVFSSLECTLRNLISSLKSVGELQNQAIRERHWLELLQTTKILPRLVDKMIEKFAKDPTTKLADLMGLNLHNYEEEVKNVVDKAVKESSMEKTIKELHATWAVQEYELEIHTRTQTKLIKASEELIEILEDNQVQLQNMAMSKYIGFFREEVDFWQKRLSTADQVLSTFLEVQRTWSHLESIFIATEDIRCNLPDDSARFDSIDANFKSALNKMQDTRNVVAATNQDNILPELENLQEELALCEKALANYLETKRVAFPRFYFISSADLLDILSNGNEPIRVTRHLAKLFDSFSKLEFNENSKNNVLTEATAMTAKDGELVPFHETCICVGAVEEWLGKLEAIMRQTIKQVLEDCVYSYDSGSRDSWILQYMAQCALCGTQIWWTSEVNEAFQRLEDGSENALKDYHRKQVNQLNTLINLLLGNLSRQERQKIMTVCTIDVHSRDVVGKLVQTRVENAQAFQWQSQLRHRWDVQEKDCFANICDAEFRYWYEYLGNTPRLVITALTDRCYITLTQSLHLIMGGSPSGPAGTGKTETTKDLGRALGMMVYVFNCSEQMDYRSIGNIYKGLAQTGAWGCFDEFNRITVEVLSVIAVQVKSIQDAIRTNKPKFNFMGEDISLQPTVGLFITMNPGYAGRSELPENLKALFRPCAMVVPDFELICEIMLVAEGFQDARVLARKFITLYTLCKELLSKQDHYDWGLRAIKSVLVVAGSLKRNDPERPEDEVLMRALRDFNVPKVVAEDVPVFMGLIGDLFPALEVPRKRDVEFEKAVKDSAKQLNLQAEESFILKVVQLQEIIEVRHSVFIIGNAGTGKSQVWKTLYKTHQILKHKPTYNDLNPKAVTNDELFGAINPATREWKDGILSVLMRDQSNLTGDGPKWIILDGDIDPMWIESLNTVMDENKVLTLASNERIALTKMMRLIFEIYTLRTATPATVSRAGILYINPHDLGWNAYATSWVEKRESSSERAIMTLLFEKYVPSVVEMTRNKFRKIIPIPDISHVEVLCTLLDCLIVSQNIPPDNLKEICELYFVFACIWSFGAATFQDQHTDHRAEFSKWWIAEFKSVKFPADGSVFDYYIDQETKKLVPWTNIVPKFELDADVPLQATLVHTPETIRVKYFLDLLIEKGYPALLVGPAGSGKSVLVMEKLVSLPENYAVANIPFNYYTTSEMLQRALERPLEKKAGRTYGPPGGKKLVYFIDDLNMPRVDEYGTVQPHTLIRQHLDYHHWYDRLKVSVKDINNVQYVACMNPTAGSFTINPRLQRHFAVFALQFPGSEALHSIYSSVLSHHLGSYIHKFLPPIQNMCESIVTSAVALHAKVSSSFVPTALKFHYLFNLRDLSNIFQGLLFSSFDCLQQPIDVVRLWMHEATRVYGDKLVDEKDIGNFKKMLQDVVKKEFEDMDEVALFTKPLMYCHFSQGTGDPKYMPVTDFSSIQTLLSDALATYNEFNPVMNLVLFEDAINYICRISRILESPRGNALLVGVGGSGKQSLSRLGAFLSALEVFQIALKKGYGVIDLKSDLATLYIKAGQKNLGQMFLMTDAHVADEEFLVPINDMLATGEIPDLLPDDEMENIIASMRTEVKGVGLPDTRENCFTFFINRVRKSLKVVLCFSPVGTTLRGRSRKFPAVTNCTSIVWFQGWPHEALMSVSQRFVKSIEVLPKELLDPIATFMSFVHTSVNDMSRTYLTNDKRYNYTTPKSFLEQIDLYKKLVTEKNNEALSKADRLESGLTKLDSCAEQVEELKKILAVQQVVLQEKNDKADRLITAVETETKVVSKEKEHAAIEEKKVAVVADEVAKIKEVCRIELEKAEPALQAAYAALNTLNKANLTELKTFTSPSPDVISVVSAVYILWEGTRTGKIPKDRSWKSAKSAMMTDAQKFLEALINLNKEAITSQIVDAITPYVEMPGFDPDNIRAKSFAAAGLCSYVINVLKYNEVYQDVAPKRKALQDATDSLNRALDRLKYLNNHIKELEEKLENLTKEYDVAMDAKMKCQAEADKTAKTIDLANRLVGGLGAEKIRWMQNVKSYRESTKTIPGDMLLVTAFVSYLGCFTKKYRVELLEKTWIPYLQKMNPSIPMSSNVDPLKILTDDAEIARWNNYGLPSDRMSAENAAILTNSQRWPLMIDPQLQGIKWIKSMHGSELKVVRLWSKGYLDSIEEAVAKGCVVLIEGILESVDPVLEPLLARNLIKKGTAIKFGDHEIDYNPSFRLILQTKLANPHYKPELQAQTTLINFTVTREGLEDQLLAEVVKMERPDLESQKSELTKQQNEFKILLKKLEDDLLTRLQSAEGNFLDDTALVENLETTKRTAQDVEVKAREAIVTTAKIDAARDLYRPAAGRASLLYFILNDLNMINKIYQFSLKAFATVFQNAIKNSIKSPDVSERVINLIDAITYSVWLYTTRGLFECDKLIFTAQVAFQLQLKDGSISSKDLDFLLRFPVTPNSISPVDFLSNNSWGGIKCLSTVEDFRNLDRDIEGTAKRWKKYVDADCPEKEKLPQDWRSKSGVQKLCIIRCLRPDRMTYALSSYIEEALGKKYVKSRRMDFAKSYEETSNTTPIFFILSPGVDPLNDVESLGKKLGISIEDGNFHNVSLGQGQEIVAERALKEAAKKGHWVILQNIHLVAKWLPTLEKRLEQNWENSHEDYRVFLSAEPASRPENHIIPQGILESSIKITNEPPTGMQANLHKALDNFSQDTLETCSKELEFKAILFSLCYFHAVVAERRKFGTLGWNRPYPFNTGDLTISVNVLYNYLEANVKVPWEDLRYLFGEIMYGGHITDDWDRKLCRTYLEEYMHQELLDGEIQYAPGFPAPPSTDYSGYHQYIDDGLPSESPILYGLHPNAEIGFLTATSENLFRTIFELQPRDSGSGGGTTITKEEKVKQTIDEILDKLPDAFNMSDISSRAEEKTPYVIVALQECTRMNSLTMELKRSLRELDLGLKGELTITAEMENLSNALFMDQIPPSWNKLAYPSTHGLGGWYADLLLRTKELESWTSDFLLPSAVWLAGFFNPQSFLTAIMQSTARKQELPLDKMCLQCEVTKKFREELTGPPKDGASVSGLFIEGARWDLTLGILSESKIKELFASLPVMHLKAITQDKADVRNMYECPLYKTRIRGPYYVWTFNLRTREKPSKWVLAGVALLLQV